MMVAAAALCLPLSVVAQTVYDFSAGAGVDRFAYGDSVASSPIPPISNTTPASEIPSLIYPSIAISDSSVYSTGTYSGSLRAAMRYVFTVVEPRSTITDLEVLWEGRGTSAGVTPNDIDVWAWNVTTTTYTLVGSTQQGSTPDAVISKLYTTDAQDYVDGANQVTMLVTNSTSDKGILVDYVKITVTGFICQNDGECDDADVCTDDVCDAGVCEHTNNTDPCDDGLFCTATDVCSEGSCVGGGDPCPGQICDEDTDSCVDCIIDDDCDDGVGCTDDTCATGSCLFTPNDANCDDGLYCNGAETCDSVLDCQLGSDPCDDAIGCTDDSCDEVTDTCTNTPNDANCDDGLYCNGAETCDSALDCQPGLDPCDDAIGCTDDSCDEVTDACTNAPNDANCDDGLYCSGTETCDAVLDCQPGSDPCDDAVGCTDDSCDEVTDTCSNTPNDANCDDGLYCNGAETCDAVLDCQPGSDPCDDAVGCTNDSCEELTDTCTNTPNDANCPDDGAYCSGLEVCDSALDCISTGDPCQPTEMCNEATDTCDECLVDGDCDDGLLCTDNTCVSGVCQYTPAGEITIDLQIEGLGHAVDRDVTFVITTCSAAADTRVETVAFAADGIGAIGLTGIDTDATWISTAEGHTLRRLEPLSFVSCAASVDWTGANALRSGDFHTAVVPKDHVVDVTDFSILAANFNLSIDANLGTGADATGNGVQGTEDFTAIQVNFFSVGDPVDGCPASAEGRGLTRPGGVSWGYLRAKRIPLARIAVEQLPFDDAQRADLNGDGVVDAHDIRAFAGTHGLLLEPQFARRLKLLEAAP